MAEVFDLDAFIAEKTGEPFRFRFGGADYELPPSIDIRIPGMLSNGDIAGAFRRMVGADQWERISASDAVLDQRAMLELVKRYVEHSGLGLGE